MTIKVKGLGKEVVDTSNCYFKPDNCLTLGQPNQDQARKLLLVDGTILYEVNNRYYQSVAIFWKVFEDSEHEWDEVQIWDDVGRMSVLTRKQYKTLCKQN